jgi:hypothetical protein
MASYNVGVRVFAVYVFCVQDETRVFVGAVGQGNAIPRFHVCTQHRRVRKQGLCVWKIFGNLRHTFYPIPNILPTKISEHEIYSSVDYNRVGYDLCSPRLFYELERSSVYSPIALDRNIRLPLIVRQSYLVRPSGRLPLTM